jgi:hypothetical protein
MKRLKVEKCISSVEGVREILIEERHNKCQKSMMKARIKKIEKIKKKILNYKHVS